MSATPPEPARPPAPLAPRVRDTYGVRDVALLFGVRTTTVRSWMRSGKLPKPARIGQRAIRWRREDIDKLFDH